MLVQSMLQYMASAGGLICTMPSFINAVQCSVSEGNKGEWRSCKHSNVCLWNLVYYGVVQHIACSMQYIVYSIQYIVHSMQFIVQCGVVQCGAVWRSVVQCSMLQCRTVRYGAVAGHGTVWQGMVSHCVVKDISRQYNSVQQCTEQLCMLQHCLA